MKFKKEDVIKIANALVEDAVWFRDGGDYDEDGYDCDDCCGRKTSARDEFKHDLACPVLLAQDLLIQSGKIVMKFKTGDKVIYTYTGLPVHGAVGYIIGFSHTGIDGDLVYDINFNGTMPYYRTYGKYLIPYSKEAMLKFNLDSTLKEK